jgi:predicted dehydrogenase
VPAAYLELDDMLGDARLDVVHIATPPSAHASNAIACLNAGVGVFVEKPLGLSTAECEAIGKAATRSGRPLGVNHNLTFHPSVRRLVRGIQEGRLGALEHVGVCYGMPLPELAKGHYAHWLFRRTENVIFELGPHPLSLIERLLGPVVALRALPTGGMTLPSGVRFYPTWQVAMDCQRGTAHLYLSVAGAFLDTSLRVVAEDGSAEVNLRRNTLRLSEKSSLLRPRDDLRDCMHGARSLAGEGIRNFKDHILSSLGRPVPFPASHSAMNESIRAFHSAVSNGVVPPVGFAQGASVVRACELVVAPALDSALIRSSV